MTTLGSGPETCIRCGMVAVGYARIGDDRLCHGDDQRPSCYEVAQRSAYRFDPVLCVHFHIDCGMCVDCGDTGPWTSA